MAIKLSERNARVCFKLTTGTTTYWWQASGSESKKQYDNQLFHFVPLTQQMATSTVFLNLDQAQFGVNFVHTLSLPTLQPFTNGGLIAPRDGNKDCQTVATVPMLPAGYVVNASRIGERRMILVGYRLADLLTRILRN
jgi:hypothetical protein